MFGLFKKKKKSLEKWDKVWATDKERQHGMIQSIEEALKSDQQVNLFYYFKKTRENVEFLLNQHEIEFRPLEKSDRNSKLVLINADDALRSMSAQHQLKRRAENNNHVLFFAEHYPVLSVENQLMDQLLQLSSQKATFFTALDEPLMVTFGSERIAGMMENMGYKENECIEHAMITKSISRAQDKIEKSITVDEVRADAQEEWFRFNVQK